jgi:2-methylaconitate cis-trans-isomerase PrpF
MKKTMMILTAGAATAALAIPGAAAASDDEVENSGQCTGGTTSKIKVKPDDGQLEVEFEVDQNQTGDRWKVKLKDNGDKVFKGSATTRGPSGSFSIERKIPNKSGTDSITGIARNTDGGERCAARVSI